MPPPLHDFSAVETDFDAGGEPETAVNYPDTLPESRAPRSDYFVERDGEIYAGHHLLVDLWGASGLRDIELMERALRQATAACEATLLHIHLHRFTDNGGISGVAVLAESHISVHSWPERGFAAFDIFMCGRCDPARAIPVLRGLFRPDSVTVTEQKRGVIG